MVPPATKRRKLKHDEEFAESSTEENVDGALSSDERPVEVDVNDDSDLSMEEPDELDEEELTSDGELSEGDEANENETEALPVQAVPRIQSVKNDNSARKRRDPGSQPQDGVYTGETFKSNVFKLQVDELLEQVKPKYGKKEAPAEEAMRTLKSLIEQLPSREPMLITEAEATLKSCGVVIPFPSPPPPKDVKYRLQYERPSSINATGSYPLKTATRSESGLVIDLMVTMPEAIFQDKDYLNYRYFYKRAYYLACLAAGIGNSREHRFKLSFDCLNGNQLQPILVVRSNGEGGAADFSSSNCRINIILTIPEGIFPQAKLAPRANCIRPKSLNNEDSASRMLASTPFYNSSLQSDSTVTSYLKLLHSASSRSDAFKDACILGRIWLRQRGFGGSLREGGFGNFEWAAVTALLLQPSTGTGAQSLSPGYSSYQLFKATLQFLARHDLFKTPFTFQAQSMSFPKAGHAPVLYDGARGLNVLFKMTLWSYSRLKLEAQMTIDTLADSLFDQFDATFILKTDLSKYRYDATLEIPLSAFGITATHDSYYDQIEETYHKVYSTLLRALTDRVTAISLLKPEIGPWPVSTCKSLESQHSRVLVSFATDPANAHRTVDHGPAAEDKHEAASFRKFWGEKSELRRFRDGSILESVVWSTNKLHTSILEQIVLYILSKHVAPSVADKANFTCDTLAHLIHSGSIQGHSGVSSFSPAMNAFLALEKDIHGLEGLPLQVRHIRAADAQLRYSSVAAPGDIPASIVLQFEASARWPDDLCAIQRTKIAFLLKLSELLPAAHSTYGARVGLENPSQPSQNQAYLDIVAPSKLSFRLRIYHDREVTLLERQLKDKSLDAQSRESAAASLAIHKRDFVQALSHTQAIQNLCTRYPALSPAIRLTKYWFASHLLSSQFSPELIELLVLRTFLQPHPWPLPSCATTGFLRTLAWISRWDWRHVPLIVDVSSTVDGNYAESGSALSGRMKAEDVESVQTRFEAWRQIDPAMNRVVLFAATNLDTNGNTWTDKGRPEKVAAARMTVLAKAATAAVRADEDKMLALANGSEPAVTMLTPESLFTSQVQDFDLVIHISSKFIRVGKKTSEPIFKNLEHQQTTRAFQASENRQLATLFVEDLQQIYGDAVLFFYDFESSAHIAGLWNPGATAQRAFKVKAGWNSVPVKSSKKKEVLQKSSLGVDVKINKGAIVDEIKRLGGELVARIDANR